MVEKITEISIISLFLNDYSRKCYLREIASELDKPHQSIKPYLNSLVKKKIFVETRRKNILEYSLNFKNRMVYDSLTVAEKDKTGDALRTQILLKSLYDGLSVFFQDNTFLIFGSAADEIKKAADIDLLVIGKAKLKKEIDDFENVYSKKIHLVQVEDLNELNTAFIKEIYKKHLVLNNTEEIIRFFGGLYEANKLV